MIATILTKSSNFHAVEYNERKVSQGKAELLEMTNFGYLHGSDNINAQTLKDYLIKYSKKNERIEYPQFHVAFSCKGHSHTKEQLVEIAHKWLQEMGYGKEGQPLLIYSHNDTDNTHIHIITSRVAPDGSKIDHNHERRRSQEILNKIMDVDRKLETEAIIKKSFQYRFSTIGQFQAILESSGYETYQKDGDIYIKKDGIVQSSLPISDVELHFSRVYKNDSLARRKQLKAIMQKYRDLCANKAELIDTMQKKFGLDLVFHGSKDKPYGYTLVDHKNKIVYRGSEVLAIKDLLVFDLTKRERTRENILGYIRAKVSEQSDISTFEINSELRKKFNAYITTDDMANDYTQIKTGIIVCGHNKFALEQDLYDKLRFNGRVKWLQAFNPTSEGEKQALMRFGKIENDSLLQIGNVVERSKIDDTIDKLNSILSSRKNNVYEAFYNEGMILILQENSYYVIDWKNKTIVDLTKEGIDTSLLKKNVNQLLYHQSANKNDSQQMVKHSSLKESKGFVQDSLRPSGINGTNREWEVGKNGRWDEVDDERSLKR